MKTIKKTNRIKDGFIVLILIATISTVSHFYIADRLRFLQFIYPAEAFIARFKVNCSDNVPKWMPASLRTSTAFSLAGQLAYTDAHGTTHHCEMGWQGNVLFSESVTSDSYFRFASLTKVVTSLAYAALLRADKINDDHRLLTYFPSDKAPSDSRLADIKIGHLHQHTAGYDRLITPDPMFLFKKRPWCPSNMGKLYDLILDFTPGERPAYSNLSYCFIGEIIADVQDTDYRTALDQLLQFSSYDLSFFNGDYLPREVQYDFRNTGFYGKNYYRYFNYEDSIAAISLVGTAKSFSQLIFDHKDLLEPLFSLDLDAHSCQPEKFRTCYYYSMQPMQKGKDGLLVFSHSGKIWGSTAFMMLDEHGGVFTWVGKGSPKKGSTDFDDLKWKFYDLLSAHYQSSPPSKKH